MKTITSKNKLLTMLAVTVLSSLALIPSAKADNDDHRGSAAVLNRPQEWQGREHRVVEHREENRHEIREQEERREAELREREWREHELNARRWHRHYVTLYPEAVPTVVYAPPAVIYTPPPEPTGINLIFPLDLR